MFALPTQVALMLAMVLSTCLATSRLVTTPLPKPTRPTWTLRVAEVPWSGLTQGACLSNAWRQKEKRKKISTLRALFSAV